MMALSGDHCSIDFSTLDLRGSTLSGTFLDCDFRACDLRGARLIGTFVDCDFTGAIMDSTTRRTGRFL